ncbi:unnamed protein product [Adineta ricciae]|uniref:Ubiquitin conjugation factor E4 A n=1 Tax=Adineta ricciae TaxID=249248 RepID=A0A814BDC6_ADIRI|nr:unnamed protein product [Adineta ricciae]
MPKSSIIATNDSLLCKDILDIILLCTTDVEATSVSRIYLAELGSINPRKKVISQIDEALIERLQISDLLSQLVEPTNASETSEERKNVIENRCLHYLSECYQRLTRERDAFESIFDDLQTLFINHSKTAITTPDMYRSQDLAKQWFELLLESRDKSSLREYIGQVNKELLGSVTHEVKRFYRHVFRSMYQAIQPLDYFSEELITYITILIDLSQHSALVKIIFEISHPRSSWDRFSISNQIQLPPGKKFEDTLVGTFLCKSSLPSLPVNPYPFFENPKSLSERMIEMTENTIYQPLRKYQEYLTQLFKAFVRNADVRNDVLQWIGDCFHENQEKNKEYSPDDPLLGFAFVSDGFFLNLNIVLLQLSRPFAEAYSPKLLKINPVYCISQTTHVHLKELYNAKPMISRQEGIERDSNISDITFNFITESFFMAHLSCSYSVNRLRRILGKTSEHYSRIKEAYQNTVQSFGENDYTTRLANVMDKTLTAFYNIRCVLNEPCLLELSNALFTATCTWLVHLALLPITNQASSEYEKLNVLEKLPLKFPPNRQLSYIPEFLVENVISYFKFLEIYNSRYMQSIIPSVNEYVNFILVFMGDSSRLRSPHLRGSLANMFETILSFDKSDDRPGPLAEMIFRQHPFIEHIPRVSLEVFVSIELTGQSVEFYQKFNYRRPMYAILECLWAYENQREQLQKLAAYAERHIDEAEAPLFLRFINLLINDANFLLDEAISHMAQLRTIQEEKESGNWNNLPEQQREEKETSLRRTGQTARFMNIMGMKTLTILAMITEEIQSIFCHQAICSRLAAMLNYFLQRLVGPDRRNLKVRDMKDYQFEPQKLVSKVSDIYLNFADVDQFCTDVRNDGMSYKDELFSQAAEVLERIGHPRERITRFIQLGERIKEKVTESALDALEDAPDEYVDPITAEIMDDPVKLPTSGKIVNYTTIYRHLLSDQFDPFNRNPLRMQDVIRQTELKREIERWKASNRQ